jgi:hypothetical protein
VFCEAIEQLQRDALAKPRPELVVKVDRSGLNEHHPIVGRLYRAIDRVLRPIVAAEEKRAGAHLIGAPRAVTARDQVGLRALNDLLKAAFDQPGRAAVEPGQAPTDQPLVQAAGRSAVEGRAGGSPPAPEAEQRPVGDEAGAPAVPVAALWFKQSPLRLHPGEKRTVTLLADPEHVAPGSPIEVEADAGLGVLLRRPTIPAPGRRGASAVAVLVRARVTAEPGARLAVLAAAGPSTAELEVLVVRHRAAGWVREIARQADDQPTEAEFDPETGVVTVHEGRREFRALERAALRAGYTRRRVAEYVPYRMLEVEAAANAVYAWAAEQVLARRLPGERPQDPGEYAAAVRHEQQALRHRAHPKLMQAFLEPEVFEGAVALGRPAPTRPGQLRLLGDEHRSG